MGSRNVPFYDFSQGKLTVSLTTACNLRCIMCPVIRPGHTLKLTREMALDVADFGARRAFGMIEFTGGEPFLLDYTHELIESACSSPRSKIMVTTNATRLGPEDADRLSRFSNLQIQVSFDGLGDVHDAIRGKAGAFARADRAVRALAKRGVSISLNTVIQRSNYRHLYELYEYFSDLPYSWHGMNPYEPHSPNMAELRIPAEEHGILVAQLRRIQEAADKAGKPVVLSEHLLHEFGERIAKRDDAEEFVHPGLLCTVPHRAVFVDANGKVSPCIHLAWNAYISRRSLTEQTIEEVIESRDYRDGIRRATGVGGCPGCSTMCYNFDPTFQRKVMNPNMYDAMLFDVVEDLRNRPNAHAPA